jgi:hypothetical protein
MVFEVSDNRLILRDILPSSPAAKIPAWQTRIRGAWLRKIGEASVATEDEAVSALKALSAGGSTYCDLVFSHPEVSQGLTNEGTPQINLDQMNPRRMMSPSFCFETMVGAMGESFIPDRPHNGLISVQERGNVLNYVSKAMKLTRGKLRRGDERSDWQKSEWMQLEQYEQQGMFGDPIPMSSKQTVFCLV